MPRNTRRPLTNPRTIRLVLDDVDATTVYQAAKKHGIHHKTVYRWVQRRETEQPGWPTLADIEAWEADQVEHRARRDRQTKRTSVYRKKVYLNRGPLQVPALGTTRRLQALYALGWTQPQIARRLGVASSRVGHMMTGLYPVVFPDTARKVAALYDELCMTVPQDKQPSRRGEVRVHERARRTARKRGYVPPLGWLDIDDPNEKPARATEPNGRKQYLDHAAIERRANGDTTVRVTRDEAREVVRRLYRQGFTPTFIEREIQLKPERYLTLAEFEAEIRGGAA